MVRGLALAQKTSSDLPTSLFVMSLFVVRQDSTWEHTDLHHWSAGDQKRTEVTRVLPRNGPKWWLEAVQEWGNSRACVAHYRSGFRRRMDRIDQWFSGWKLKWLEVESLYSLEEPTKVWLKLEDMKVTRVRRYCSYALNPKMQFHLPRNRLKAY